MIEVTLGKLVLNPTQGGRVGAFTKLFFQTLFYGNAYFLSNTCKQTNNNGGK
jgi:hypothetical protein